MRIGCFLFWLSHCLLALDPKTVDTMVLWPWNIPTLTLPSNTTCGKPHGATLSVKVPKPVCI